MGLTHAVVISSASDGIYDSGSFLLCGSKVSFRNATKIVVFLGPPTGGPLTCIPCAYAVLRAENTTLDEEDIRLFSHWSACRKITLAARKRKESL